MADTLYQLCLISVADLFDHFIAEFAVSGVDANFDQFVVIQGKGYFLINSISKAIAADDNDRL